MEIKPYLLSTRHILNITLCSLQHQEKDRASSPAAKRSFIFVHDNNISVIFYSSHWNNIRITYRVDHIQNILNLRLSNINLNSFHPTLWNMFHQQINSFKINLNFDFILRNRKQTNFGIFIHRKTFLADIWMFPT